MPFGYGIGDHRAFVLDIPLESMIGIDPVKIVRPVGRRLNRPRPQTRGRGSLLLPPLKRNVDDDNNNDAAASGTPAAIRTWAKAEAVDAARAIFSDAGACTSILFLGRFFCARKQAFYGRTNLDFILWYSWCYYAIVPKNTMT
jgi:hypothetical protein